MGLIRLLVIDNDTDNISVLELIGQPPRKGRNIDRDGNLGAVESGQYDIGLSVPHRLAPVMY